MTSALASKISQIRSLVGMAYVGWLPFTHMHVQPVDLQGRTALISGANVGIGYECALKLANFGANVWLLCRDPVKAEAARSRLVKATGNDQITVAVVDFGSIASVQQFVDRWDRTQPIDIVINNAGLVSGRFLRTPDGHELTHQTNFLSHLLLTLGLLPYMAERARIVNMSSYEHYTASPELINPDDLDSDGIFKGKLGLQLGDELTVSQSLGLYSKAKALQVIFGRQLQMRLAASPAYAEKNIVVHSCHPGLIKSSIWSRPTTLGPSAATVQKILTWLCFTAGTSCEQGACTPVFLATAPEAAIHGGGYWDRMSERTPSVIALDDTLGDALWGAWLSMSEFEGLAKGLEKQW